LAIRLECINLYLEGKSMREIGRSLDVHHTTVSRWLRKLGEDVNLFREK
jgi:transposase-like protein